MARRSILSALFGSKAAEPTVLVLPDLVRETLDTAAIFWRPGTGDHAGEDRAIVQLPGWNGFIFSPESAVKVISKAWPELSDPAVGRAVRRLAGTVAARRRQHVEAMAALHSPGEDRRPWLTRY